MRSFFVIPCLAASVQTCGAAMMPAGMMLRLLQTNTISRVLETQGFGTLSDIKAGYLVERIQQCPDKVQQLYPMAAQWYKTKHKTDTHPDKIVITHPRNGSVVSISAVDGDHTNITWELLQEGTSAVTSQTQSARPRRPAPAQRRHHRGHPKPLPDKQPEKQKCGGCQADFEPTELRRLGSKKSPKWFCNSCYDEQPVFCKPCKENTKVDDPYLLIRDAISFRKKWYCKPCYQELLDKQEKARKEVERLQRLSRASEPSRSAPPPKIGKPRSTRDRPKCPEPPAKEPAPKKPTRSNTHGRSHGPKSSGAAKSAKPPRERREGVDCTVPIPGTGVLRYNNASVQSLFAIDSSPGQGLAKGSKRNKKKQKKRKL